MDTADLRALRPADAAMLADFAVDLGDRREVGSAAERVLAFAVRAVPCDYAGLLLGRDEPVDRAYVSDPWLRASDRFQAEQGEGPYLTMPRERDILVLDTVYDERWPHWSPRLAAQGMRSVLCLRLRDGRAALGTFALYALEPDRFGARETAMARMVAQHAGIAIGAAQLKSELWRAAELRGYIGQAQGILMERFALDPAQAFAVLRHASRDTGVSVGEAARRLVSTGELPVDGTEFER